MTLAFTHYDTFKLGTVSNCEVLKTPIDIPELDGPEVYMGLDPGHTNMGLAWIGKKRGELFQVGFPPGLSCLERIHYTRKVINWILSLCPKPEVVTVENAAFGAPYRQVPLAEHRTTAIISFMNRGWPVKVIAPKTIRKYTFDDGNQKAEELWPNLPPDSISALACAYHAYVTRETPVTDPHQKPKEPPKAKWYSPKIRKKE